MVPHAIITVSLATAVLPRLSAQRRRRTTSPASPRTLADTLRTALALIVPFALLLPLIATDAGQRDLGLRRGRRRRRPLRAVARPVRRRAGLLHRPLPDAARLLRPGADPHGVLGPVRRSRRSTSCWPLVLLVRDLARRHLPGPGPRLRRGVRRRRGRVVPPCCAACSADSDTASCCGSRSGSWSRPASRPPVAAGLALAAALATPRRRRHLARSLVLLGVVVGVVDVGGLPRCWPGCCALARSPTVVDTVTRRLPVPGRR